MDPDHLISSRPGVPRTRSVSWCVTGAVSPSQLRSTIMAEIQALMEAKREEEWRRAGVLECDIAFSRLSGIGAPDVRTFREFSRRGLLIVVRCPKLTARPWHGLLPPKPMVISKKIWET